MAVPPSETAVDASGKTRALLDEGAFLELQVKVDKDWQRHDATLNALGYGSPGD